MKYFKAACLILVALLWFSCTDHIIYHASHPFNKEGWDKKDTVSLDIQITDSIPNDVEISLLLRNYSNYPYQDFVAMVMHNLPDSTSWRSYKVSILLAEPNGRWTGSGWGGLYQSSVSLGKAFIAEPGNYTFKIVHQMNDGQLSGLNDIGIMVKKKIIEMP